ncbi:MAG: DUF1573 domain-containing protein [Mucinivorans sp.]
MRKIIFILLFAATSFVAKAQALFDHYNYDFGQIKELAGAVEHTFSYTNGGKEPLVVLSVSVSCGCTTPTYSTKPLPSGAEAQFTVRFDPTDRPGRFEKYIYLRTTKGEVKLSIEGTVIPRPRTMEDDFPYLIYAGVRLSALALNLEHAPLGRAIVRGIGVANSSLTVSATIALDTLSLPSWLKARVKEPVLGPGARSEIIFEFKGSAFGFHQADVPLVINGDKQAEKIWISVVFTRDFASLSAVERNNAARAEFSSYFYHFSDQKLGAPLTRRFEVRNSGQSDLVIDHIESSDPAVTFSIDRQSIAPSARATLTITARPKTLGTMSETVRIISNDPQNPVRELRVMANII